MAARALFHVGKGQVAAREVPLAAPGTGEVLVRSLYSGISAGTEAMIFAGDFPRGEALDAALPELAGRFEYPFRYGYAVVGRVIARGAGVPSEWDDALVFVFHPHQDRIVVPVASCQRVPADVAPQAALYFPQVETALTLVLDAAPLIGERAIVFGLGVVGLFVARLLSDFPLERLVAAEPLEWRRRLAREWGIPGTFDPTDAAAWCEHGAGLDADFALELSGNPAALAQAIEATGFDGRLVVGSWYGTRAAALDLGSRFHRQRQRIVSSQVSTLAPALRGRWDRTRRTKTAWRTLARLAPERLPARFFPLEACQEAFETVRARPEGVLQLGFRYD
ncbi:MAG TPA: zinc-binding dehydrogenase [Burkholderiales bacterium]